MTQSKKIIAVIAVAVVLVGAMWWFIESANAPAEQESNNTNQTQNNSANQIPHQNTQTGSKENQQNMPANNSDASATSPTDTSDAAIDKDLSSVDNQMNNLNADSGSIDQGLNDQPIAQGQ